MPQYLSPGVYVEEIDAGAKPIAGVGTSTAGFVGQVANNVTMPAQPGKFVTDNNGKIVLDNSGNPTPILYAVAAAGVPRLVTSWEQFRNTFGDVQAGNKTLALAVYGFFNNGGTRCWVNRLTDATDAGAVGKALDTFRAVDEIAIVAVPGATDVNVQGAVLDHCEKAGDRFGIIDGQRTSSLTPADIQGTLRNSNYAAVYYPWISVFDPDTKTNIFQPPSGHLAGIYARSDTNRGVHKAPANEVISGAVGVENRLSKADQDGLNPAGINIIRLFGSNVTVWGARTIGGDANLNWKYVNVRRLFLYLRKSIDQGTQWVVFEPNSSALWSQITRNVTAFLTNVWRAGALFGATPVEAFYVHCDATTNPPEVRDLGQVVTEIGVAVVKPAEFVIFRISQWAGPGS
jgi:uncharacterized protein